MPELPEVEITVRRIGEAIAEAPVESALAPGLNVLKTHDPPLSTLAERTALGARRRGKLLIVDFEGGLSLLMHLMSAGRLQLFEKRAGPKDRTSRLLVRFPGGRELRLREFGTRQRAWAKLLRTEALEADDAVAHLGPEAWPEPPPFEDLLAAPRPLHSLLRDQHVIAGIGRSWADEVLHGARLSPFKRGDDLTPEEADALRHVTKEVLGTAIEHYERTVQLPIPDKLPMPLTVHRREGEPCPRCGTPVQKLVAAGRGTYVCPHCQRRPRRVRR
jgi:formamidopyrimidine-DNA glycosylase